MLSYKTVTYNNVISALKSLEYSFIPLIACIYKAVVVAVLHPNDNFFCCLIKAE